MVSEPTTRHLPRASSRRVSFWLLALAQTQSTISGTSMANVQSYLAWLTQVAQADDPFAIVDW